MYGDIHLDFKTYFPKTIKCSHRAPLYRKNCREQLPPGDSFLFLSACQFYKLCTLFTQHNLLLFLSKKRLLEVQSSSERRVMERLNPWGFERNCIIHGSLVSTNSFSRGGPPRYQLHVPSLRLMHA